MEQDFDDFITSLERYLTNKGMVVDWDMVMNHINELEACEAIHILNGKDDPSYVDIVEIPGEYPKHPDEQLWLFDMEKLDKSWTPF